MAITYTEGPIDRTAHTLLLRSAHPKHHASWPAAVVTAFTHSGFVASAWDETLLVGTVRIIDDGIAFALIADLLVHPNYRRHGIGTNLIRMCQHRYAHYHLYADPANAAAQVFYRAIGFKVHEVMVHIPATVEDKV